jgi:hypothetical protein
MDALFDEETAPIMAGPIALSTVKGSGTIISA